jgi:hypothetical protein
MSPSSPSLSPILLARILSGHDPWQDHTASVAFKLSALSSPPYLALVKLLDRGLVQRRRHVLVSRCHAQQQVFLRRLKQ